MKACPWCWYEYMSTDVNASIDFYHHLFGWNSAPAGFGDRSYTVLSVGTAGIGGIFGLTPEMVAGGGRPIWMGYVAVEDVDATTARAATTGGRVLHAPADIPEVGRFSMVADPSGAPFIVFRPFRSEPMPTPTAGAPGTIAWTELHTDDLEASWAFYSGLFGWSVAQDMDMGPMGVYRLFGLGGEPVGGMMKRVPPQPPSWLYYFNVDGVEAAIARATAKGGQLVMGPHQVPTGQWIAIVLDPLGAPAAMLSRTR